MMAVKPRAAKSTLTLSRARTAVSPFPYTLAASTGRAAGSWGGVVTHSWLVVERVGSSMAPRCASGRPPLSDRGSVLGTSGDVRGSPRKGPAGGRPVGR